MCVPIIYLKRENEMLFWFTSYLYTYVNDFISIILTLNCFSVFMQQFLQIYFLIQSSLLQFSCPIVFINNTSSFKEDPMLFWIISCWDSTVYWPMVKVRIENCVLGLLLRLPPLHKPDRRIWRLMWVPINALWTTKGMTTSKFFILWNENSGLGKGSSEKPNFKVSSLSFPKWFQYL